MRRSNSILRFKLGVLGGDQAEHDILAARDQAQRLEASGALGIVFQEKGVRIERAEEFFGDGVVAAFGVPAAAAVAAANMKSASDACLAESPARLRCRLRWTCRIPRPDRSPRCVMVFAVLRIDIVRIVRSVELDVA